MEEEMIFGKSRRQWHFSWMWNWQEESGLFLWNEAWFSCLLFVRMSISHWLDFFQKDKSPFFFSFLLCFSPWPFLLEQEGDPAAPQFMLTHHPHQYTLAPVSTQQSSLVLHNSAKDWQSLYVLTDPPEDLRKETPSEREDEVTSITKVSSPHFPCN